MPRVTLNKVQSKSEDFVRWLAGELYFKNIRQVKIADCLGLTGGAVTYKMKHCNFTFEEMLTIFQELETDKETQIKLMTL